MKEMGRMKETEGGRDDSQGVKVSPEEEQALKNAEAALKNMEKTMQGMLAEEQEKLMERLDLHTDADGGGLGEMTESDGEAAMQKAKDEMSERGHYVERLDAAGLVVDESALVEKGEIAVERAEGDQEMDDEAFMAEFSGGDPAKEFFEDVGALSQSTAELAEEESEIENDRESGTDRRAERLARKAAEYFEKNLAVDQNEAYQNGSITRAEAFEQAERARKRERERERAEAKASPTSGSESGAKEREKATSDGERAEGLEAFDDYAAEEPLADPDNMLAFTKRRRDREARLELDLEEKSSFRMIGDHLYTQGLRIPLHLEKWVTDEEKFITAGPRAAVQEERFRRHQLKMERRKERAKLHKKRYIYDGDSIFTRRQLQMSQFVKEQLNETIAGEAYLSKLKELNIHAEEVEMTRDLMSAKVFWTTFSRDPQQAYDEIQSYLPHIRRLFAKRTSHLKFSPALKFVRKEMKDSGVREAFERRLDAMEDELEQAERMG